MPIVDFPGEKLAIRIWETLEKAGIGMLRPGQLRREGRAKADVEYLQRMAVAQAERNAADVAAGRAVFDPNSGATIPTVPSIPALSEPPPAAPPANGGPPDRSSSNVPQLGSAYGQVIQNFGIREMRRAINVEKIIEKAQVEAAEAPDSEVSTEEVNPDWLTRWYENAKDVSDEEVQQLWARALAGEVQSPGKYSLRTLDFLRSVSKHEAELIQKLGPLSFMAFIYRHAESLDRLGLNFGTLAELQNIGVIAGVEAIGLHLNVYAPPKGSGSAGFLCNGLGIVVRNVTKDIQFPCYTVTSLGRELLTLGRFAPDREYVVALAKFLAEKGGTAMVGNAMEHGGQIVVLPPLETFDPPQPPAASQPSS